MKKIALVLSVLLTLSACEVFQPDGHGPDRKPYDDVMLCYMVAFNNLSSSLYIGGNLSDVLSDEAWIPTLGSRKVLLIFSHFPLDGYGYKNSPETPGYLERVYRGSAGDLCRDTLWKYEGATTAAADPLAGVTEFVRDHFDAERYGIVFSSHGTGWMPQGTYDTEPTGGDWFTLSRPQVQSFGQERVSGVDYFLDVQDLASSIRMHMDYIVFDACLMGGVETAYELRDVTDVIGFSQCEVMGAGFIYKKLASKLLESPLPDPLGVMRDAFEYYDAQSGFDRTCAVSLVRTDGLDKLADVCAYIFDKYRIQMSSLDGNSVQGYFTGDHHWFYDLEDILLKSGVYGSDLKEFNDAMNGCIVYKDATPAILAYTPILTHCGLSMYLPCKGSSSLDAFYKTLEWNRATSLVL